MIFIPTVFTSTSRSALNICINSQRHNYQKKLEPKLKDLGKMTNIFVYGTLKKNQPNHHYMTTAINGKAEYYGKGVTDEKYPLVIASKYNIPYLLNIPGLGHNIAGEIYSVDDNLLQFLDKFEGCPEHYQRNSTNIRVLACAQENTLDTKTDVNTILKCFVYSTSSYQQEWLNLPFHNNYDAFGTHGMKYINRDCT